MRRGLSVICVIAAGFGLSASAIGAEAPPPELALAPLEVAPGDLGAARSDGRMLLTSASKGKELLLLDVASGTLTRYLEASGSRWGDPQVLADDHGGFEQVFNLAANGSAVALLSPRRLTVFDRDGSLIAWSSAYLLASDIEAKGSGWALALRNMPVPGPGGFVGQEALADYQDRHPRHRLG